MHEVRFSLTGDHLDAVRHLADERAQEYLGPDFEALFTRSRAVPNTNPTNGAALSGWRVTFTYRSRPVPMPFPRRTTPVVVEPALTVEPAGDAPPAELDRPRRSLDQVAQRDAAGARAARRARIEELPGKTVVHLEDPPRCPRCGTDDPGWVADCTDPVDPFHLEAPPEPYATTPPARSAR